MAKKVKKYNHVIEDWWRHNGCYDREQASGIPYHPMQFYSVQDYFNYTDNWWDGLTNEQKVKVYEEFFSED